jgi:hypothetical protein
MRALMLVLIFAGCAGPTFSAADLRDMDDQRLCISYARDRSPAIAAEVGRRGLIHPEYRQAEEQHVVLVEVAA